MQPTSAALPIEWRDCSGGVRGRLGVLDGASRDGNSVGRGREGVAASGRTFFGVTINVCQQGPRNGESREPFPPIRRRRFGAARGVSTTSAQVSIHMPIAREARGMGGDGGRAIQEPGYLPHARHAPRRRERRRGGAGNGNYSFAPFSSTARLRPKWPHRERGEG